MVGVILTLKMPLKEQKYILRLEPMPYLSIAKKKPPNKYLILQKNLERVKILSL